MLLSEVFPEDYIMLDEAGLKSRVGKLARAGALGAASLLGGYGFSAYNATPTSASKPPNISASSILNKLDDEPTPEEPLPLPTASQVANQKPADQKPADQKPADQKPADQTQAKPPNKLAKIGPNSPHGSFPKQLLNQQNLSPSERVLTFIQVIAPTVQEVNSEILADRAHFAKISAKGHVQTPSDLEWIESKINQYKATGIADLWKRMDIIPASMAVAQSGIETGWATSSMSRNALAFFGQKVFDKSDKTAFTDQFGGRYKSAASLKDSIRNYISNLNTNSAYEDLRIARAKLRHDRKPISGRELAAHLQKYSTNPDYIKKVQGAIAGTQIASLEPK
jgi:uncharacterized FlgJ-related protein